MDIRKILSEHRSFTIKIPEGRNEVTIEAEPGTDITVKMKDVVIDVSRCVHNNKIVLAIFEKHKFKLEELLREIEEEILFIKGN